MQSYEHAKFIEKCLADYRYDRHFLDKQFKKFLDKKRCSSMYKIIMKYHMPQHVEYLTTIYEHRFLIVIFNRYVCDQRIFHNNIYQKMMKKNYNPFLTGELLDFTDIYLLTKDVSITFSILIYFRELLFKNPIVSNYWTRYFSKFTSEKSPKEKLAEKMFNISGVENYKKMYNKHNKYDLFNETKNNYYDDKQRHIIHHDQNRIFRKKLCKIHKR